MPEHYRELITNEMLFIIGGMVGRVEALYVSMPNVIKAGGIVLACVAAFFELKSDIRHVHDMQENCFIAHQQFRQDIQRNEDRINLWTPTLIPYTNGPTK